MGGGGRVSPAEREKKQSLNPRLPNVRHKSDEAANGFLHLNQWPEGTADKILLTKPSPGHLAW